MLRSSWPSGLWFSVVLSRYGFNLSTVTTFAPVMPDHVGSGTILTIVWFTGSPQIVQGPVQNDESFLAIPGFVTGVKSQTFAPVVKDFLSWWYCRLCRLTAMDRFCLA